MATTNAQADIAKAEVDRAWMVSCALYQRDPIRQLYHEVWDLKEYKGQVLFLECEIEELKREKDSLKGDVKWYKKTKATLVRVNSILFTELKHAV